MTNHFQKRAFRPLFALLLLLMACGQRPAATSPAERPQQGVAGMVRWVEGNQMPRIGQAPEPGKPVARTLYFCAPAAAAQLEGEAPLFRAIKAEIVATAQSDDQGRYAVALPAGRYSVFTKEEGGYFASIFDGQGVANPVEVKAGELTALDILINYNAAY